MKGLRIGLVFFCLGLTVSGQMAHLLNYQGRMLEGENLVNGPVSLVIRLYDQNVGGNLLCEDSNTVNVVDGLYKTYIGNNVTTGTLADLMFQTPWLEVEINGQVLTPREMMVPVLHSLNALEAQHAGSADYAVTAASADTSGLASNVSDGVISSVKIADGAVTNVDLADAAVTSIKIEDGTITYADIGQNGAGTGEVLLWNGTDWTNAQPLRSYAESDGFRWSAYASGSNCIVQGDSQAIGSYCVGSLIGGGTHNILGTWVDCSTINGGYVNRIHDHVYGATINGGEGNVIGSLAGSYDGNHSVIGGGAYNQVLADWGTIGGGTNNYIDWNANAATIAGGNGNVIEYGADGGTIAGGGGNTLWHSAYASAIGGGSENVINTNSRYGVIGGGYGNRILPEADYASIVGGWGNEVRRDADSAMIAGGEFNVAAGKSSFAAGVQAQALHDNTFVWSDGAVAPFSSTRSNQFLVHADGGVGINTADPAFDVDVRDDQAVLRLNSTNINAILRLDSTIGGTTTVWTVENGIFGSAGLFGIYQDGQGPRLVITTNGYVGIGAPGNNPTQILQVVNAVCDGNQWYDSSDRNLKENFAGVDAGALLERVRALSLYEWNYKTDDAAVRHVGPTAQDFYAAFGLGGCDTRISGSDRDGVALAAIQALCDRNEELERRVAELEVLIREMAARE